MATPQENDLGPKSESARESLRRLVDELKVQLHLASLDAKDAWHELEPQLLRMEKRLEEVSERLKEAGDEAEVQAHLAAMEARDRWEVLSDSVQNVVASILDRGRAPKRVIDHAAVQAHLARLEAADRLEKTREEVRSRLHAGRRDATQEAAKFVDGLTRSLARLKEQLNHEKKS